jgi:GT2 family glycosyltransferase
MLPRVAIIYICYNTAKYLPDVLNGIAGLRYPKDRLSLVFIPNGSPDNILDFIERDVKPRAGQDLPDIKVLNDGINHGFGKGNNQGMQWAIDQGFEYIFLHNGDLKLEPDAIHELVALAEADAQIGSVQCLIRYWHDPGKVNVTGGVIHVAGYGFARDNGKRMDEIEVKDGQDIGYASGAAVLYRCSALQRVGLFEEGFFMYHEDLELGMRLRFAGYKNVLAARALAAHDYQFSRNPKKFAWMELYRVMVVWAYYKPATLFVLLPILLGVDIGTWPLALKGGWFKAKAWACAQWLKPSTWRLLWAMRQRAQRLRVIRDADFLKFVTGKIEHQETSGPLMDKVFNPVVNGLFQVVRLLVRW